MHTLTDIAPALGALLPLATATLNLIAAVLHARYRRRDQHDSIQQRERH